MELSTTSSSSSSSSEFSSFSFIDWKKIDQNILDVDSKPKNLICVDNLGLLFIFLNQPERIMVVNLKALKCKKESEFKLSQKREIIPYLELKLIQRNCPHIQQNSLPIFFKFNSLYNLLCITTQKQCFVIDLPFEIRNQIEFLTSHETDKYTKIEGFDEKNRSIECSIFQIGAFYPSVNMLQALWHPLSEFHLCLLTSDDVSNTIRIFNLSQNITIHEQIFPSPEQGKVKTIGFCFGDQKETWAKFTIYILTDSGNIYAKCPVAPFNCSIPLSLFQTLKKRIVGLPISDLEKDLQFEWLDNIRGTKVKKNNRSYITTRIYKDEEIELQGPLLEKSVPNPSSIFFVDSLPTILMVSTKGSNINVFFADDVIPRWKENSNRWEYVENHFRFILYEEIPMEPSFWLNIVRDPTSKHRIFVQSNRFIYSIFLNWVEKLEAYLLRRSKINSNLNLPPSEVENFINFHISDILGFSLISQPILGNIALIFRNSSGLIAREYKSFFETSNLTKENEKKALLLEKTTLSNSSVRSFKTPSLPAVLQSLEKMKFGEYPNYDILKKIAELWVNEYIAPLGVAFSENESKLTILKNLCSEQMKKYNDLAKSLQNLKAMQSKINDIIETLMQNSERLNQKLEYLLSNEKCLSTEEKKYFAKLKEFQAKKQELGVRIRQLEHSLEESSKENQNPELSQKIIANLEVILTDQNSLIEKTKRSLDTLKYEVDQKIF